MRALDITRYVGTISFVLFGTQASVHHTDTFEAIYTTTTYLSQIPERNIYPRMLGPKPLPTEQRKTYTINTLRNRELQKKSVDYQGTSTSSITSRTRRPCVRKSSSSTTVPTISSASCSTCDGSGSVPSWSTSSQTTTDYFEYSTPTTDIDMVGKATTLIDGDQGVGDGSSSSSSSSSSLVPALDGEKVGTAGSGSATPTGDDVATASSGSSVVIPTIADDVTAPSGDDGTTTPSGGDAGTAPTGSDAITTPTGDDGTTTTGSNTATTSGVTTAASSSSEAFDPNTVYDGVPGTPTIIPDENTGTETPATLTTPSE